MRPFHWQTTPEVSRRVDTKLAALEREQTSPIDRILIRRWKQLGIMPSQEVDDATFIRRVTLDICGTLPTNEEVLEYVSDSRADKRLRLIDRLLERPEYASYFALKWADILRNRGSGYSTSKQRPGTALFARWIRDSIAQNKPYDQFVAEVITASGSQLENPPAVWYRQVRTQSDFVESVAQAFWEFESNVPSATITPSIVGARQTTTGWPPFTLALGVREASPMLRFPPMKSSSLRKKEMFTTRGPAS